MSRFQKKQPRSDRELKEVFGRLSSFRSAEKGTCENCSSQELGFIGPDEHKKFYCKKCWQSYFCELKDGEWKEWLEWIPKNQSSSAASAVQYPKGKWPSTPDGQDDEKDLKSVLLALSRVGGSVTFSSSLSKGDRYHVHALCEHDPELKGKMRHKSYGEDTARFLQVCKVDELRALDGTCRAIAVCSQELQEIKDCLDKQAEGVPLELLRSLQQELMAVNACISRKLGPCSTGGEEEPEQPAAYQPPPPPPPPPPVVESRCDKKEDANSRGIREVIPEKENVEPSHCQRKLPEGATAGPEMQAAVDAADANEEFPSLTAMANQKAGPGKKGARKKK